MFVGAALLICVEAPALPREANLTPPLAPTTQNRLPSSVTAPRTLFALKASVMAVEVSTPPLPSTRATTRLAVEVDVDAMLAVPRAASYPPSVRYRPSADRARAPSEVADPLIVNRRLLPEDEVGRATDCTSAPEGLYSSRNTAV